MSFKYKALLIITGVVTGICSGLFGGGGGMIVVPMLAILLSLEEKKAHATAIAVILPLTMVSSVVYILSGNFDFSIGLPVGIAFILGGGLGSFLLKKIPNKVLGIIFALVMIAGGVKLLW